MTYCRYLKKDGAVIGELSTAMADQGDITQ
jgi:hypothetical protein